MSSQIDLQLSIWACLKWAHHPSTATFNAPDTIPSTGNAARKRMVKKYIVANVW